ncbi:glutamate synthase large subunit [bacterium CPR1]|nr:glutamate synthase large subunit [bacterium CPR1]
MFSNQHDACGIGYVARVSGSPGHDIITMALEALGNHAHRGALGGDGKTGDGAGVSTQLPHQLLQREFARIYPERRLPGPGDLGLGMVFLPLQDAGARTRARTTLEECLREEGLQPLGWRDVPLYLDSLGSIARRSRPHIQQLFVARSDKPDFENALFRARRAAEDRFPGFFVVSLSSRTVVYKGLCMADQLGNFFPDLSDPAYESAVAMFHQRYCTNTMPAWELAHPFRLICHNGEFNTLQGNWNWMRAREAALGCASVIRKGVSDSLAFDNVLEFLLRSGKELLPTLLMMIPEIWENVPADDFPPGWRDMYAYLACFMEPWDGPAALSFFDGEVVGTLLDRNGLRPVRYTITHDEIVLSASEAGVLRLEDSRIAQRGMLGPGEVLLVDTRQKRIFENHQLKDHLSSSFDHRGWLESRLQPLPRKVTEPVAPRSDRFDPLSADHLVRRKLVFGYNHEEETAVLRPMITTGNEPVGSMGDDTPPAPLSRFPRPLFHFFRQRFAQVTNPPIDPLKEKLVMSLRTLLGRRPNLLTDSPDARLLELTGPVLSPADFQNLNSLDPVRFPSIVLRAVWPVNTGAQALEATLADLCRQAEEAVRQGAVLLVVYDGDVSPFRAPVPSLLLTSALHHHLLKAGLRLDASLVVASGEPREVHHFACLLGYGADAVYPYLAFESIGELVQGGGKGMPALAEAQQSFVEALERGLYKVMAKMGIALLSSYRGAQVFEALGLSRELVKRYFPHTDSLLGGVGLNELAASQARWHQVAFQGEVSGELARQASYGFYKFKRDGEAHRFHPELVKALHRSVAEGEKLLLERPEESPFAVLPEGPPLFADYLRLAAALPPVGVRDLLDFVRHRPPVALEEVEPAESIVARFSTGAMSHGSLSSEAHRTLAEAMNRLGAASNSGEGGEEPDRYATSANSKIKQIASGRFGVTPAYLLSASELQIKMAQGSKPGEGGQIPGHKVSDEIARIRHTTPGVALISPPPHHDIYSIEDLAQLIYDLKRLSPRAAVSVKLVSESGVGTVAAGVAKGFADVIHISGAEGGTGASPLSSIKFAGMPWEVGLSLAQQTLVQNRLREKVVLRVDGGFQTGRDVLVAALLGADQFSFGTSALVAEGCLMARSCHTNTCPVGIASQRPDLRAKYPGTPEAVVSFMLGVAHQVRELLASLGCRSLEEVIGRSELLDQVVFGQDAGHLDLSPLLVRPTDEQARSHQGERNREDTRGRDLEGQLFEMVEDAFRGGEAVRAWLGPFTIYNTDRTVPARLSGWLGTRYPELAEETLTVRFEGSAGQSFGAFGVTGLTVELTGEANDYVGKGLGGGTIVIRPPQSLLHLDTHRNWIVGNTVLYGATGGTLLAAGRAGQRLCVRNSGATAVVEGAGEHACEYMTGGAVVVLGTIGRNFGAAMTGGEAFLFDPTGSSLAKINGELVEAVRLAPGAAADRLRKLVELHAERTGSQRAGDLLRRWEVTLGEFWHVQPREQAARIEAHNEGHDQVLVAR